MIEIHFTKPITKISDEVDLTTLKYELEPDVWKPVLEVKVEPAEE